MLYEISNIKQNEGEPKRRWFVDEYFDLVVWSDEKDEMEAFQLCYDKTKNQHALTWSQDSGYIHNRVDDGEDKPGKPKGIPILVIDGNFDHDQVADRFRGESGNLEDKIARRVYERILAYPASDSKRDAELSAIKQVVLDYIEGWYVGNHRRVERSLHPELAKRGVSGDPKASESGLTQMSAMSLVKQTRCVARTPEGKREKEVTILDAFENASSVKLVASDWVDYIHMGRFGGRWMIVNVLREPKSSDH